MGTRWTFAVVAVLTIVGGCSDSTPTPKTEGDKLKLAFRIATIQFSTPEMGDFVANIEAQLRLIPSAFCDSMPPDKLPECLQISARYQPAMERVVEETIADIQEVRPLLVNEMAAALASAYSGDELARLLDLYESPTYQMLVERRAQVGEAYITNAMRAVQPLYDNAKARLRAAIPEGQ